MVDISLVIPVLNEEENLPILMEQIHAVMLSLGRSYECVFVDDGSTDDSLSALEELRQRYPEIRIFSFRRNFGQTAALSAGFDHAAGEIIITLDSDLQNDPADIPLLIQKLEEGFDLVSGWRKSRQDCFSRKLSSSAANYLISKVTGVRLHDSGCTLKAYRRGVIQDLHLYGEMHRFIPALASWSGVVFTEIPVQHHPRKFGRSKYGFSRTVRVILDLMTVKFFLSYSTGPIQIFGKIGLISSAFGMLVLGITIILKFSQGRTLTGNPLFYLFIFMEIIAVQFILIGLLGELNIRIYHETQKKKIYSLKNRSQRDQWFAPLSR